MIRAVMLADSFLFQLLLFALAHVAAWGNMRHGRMWLGFGQFASVWILLDFALIERFVVGETGAWYLLPLLGMQLVAIASAAEWFWRRHRRTRPTFIAAQDRDYAQALQLWMSGEDPKARDVLQPMLRRDPWDVEARLLLGTIEHETGSSRRALQLLKQAAFRTHEPLLKSEIREELRRLKTKMERRAAIGGAGRSAKATPAAAAPKQPAPSKPAPSKPAAKGSGDVEAAPSLRSATKTKKAKKAKKSAQRKAH
jgi:hypothetical protein